MSIQDIPAEERPQERLIAKGPGALSDTELIAMLLRSGNAETNVIELSQKLLENAGSLNGLLHWTTEDFQKIKGIGKVKALQLITVVEIARRILIRQAEAVPAIDGPDKVYALMRPRCEGLLVEKFWILCLNRKNHLIKCVECTSGTASASLVHPREVFREAIQRSASSIIASHNHPSGDPSPSSADIKITRQLREASKIVDIEMLDHIIIGSPSSTYPKGYYSFKESGML